MSKSKTQSRGRRPVRREERSQRPQSFQQLPSQPNTGQQTGGQQTGGQQGAKPSQGESNNTSQSPPKDTEKK